MPPKKAKSESKQGLVITLVFFILMTIGLGVAAYYGFADQEASAKAVKEAKDKEKVFQAKRNYFRAQAYVYRAMIGFPSTVATAEELNLAKEQLDKGSLGKGAKDQKEVQDLVNDKLGKRIGWDPAGKKPLTTYEDLLVKKANDYESVAKTNTELVAQLAVAAKKLKDAEDLQKDAQKNYDAELVKIKQAAKDELDKNRTTLDELRNEIVKLGGDKETLMKKVADEVTLVKKDIGTKDKDIRKLKERLARARRKSPRETGPGRPRRRRQCADDWKIIRMDPRGTMPYINLGSRDLVKPRTVVQHPQPGSRRPAEPDAEGDPGGGRHPERPPVAGADHVGQGPRPRPDHPGRHPLQPAVEPDTEEARGGGGSYWWTCRAGQHDPEAGLQDFLRRPGARKNVIVDAWMDPRDNYKVKGTGINVSTDYLVVAENLDAFDGRDRGGDSKKVDDIIKDMKNQAKEYGVQVIGLRRYLEDDRLPPAAPPAGADRNQPAVQAASRRPAAARRKTACG